MKKFVVIPCIEKVGDEDPQYDGPAIALSAIDDYNTTIIFPVIEDNANRVNSALSKEPDEHTDFLGIFKTMIESWKGSNKFLSGILIDIEYEGEDHRLVPHLILSDQRDGLVDAIVKIGFVDAILLAAIQKIEVLVTDELLKHVIPDMFDEEYGENSPDDFDFDDFDDDDEGGDGPDPFPVDDKLIQTAKNILKNNKKS